MGTLGFWRLAQADPEWIAAVDPDGTQHRAGDLLARSNRLVHGLRALGLRPGDGICGLVPNGADGLVLYLAALQAGWYYTPINWHLTGPEIAYIVSDSEAKAFFVHPRFAEEGARGAEAIAPERRFLLNAEQAEKLRQAGSPLDGFRPLSELVEGQPDSAPEARTAGATMHYTSGTTGKPKGVRRPLSGLDPDDAAELMTFLLGLFGITPGRPNAHLVTSPSYHTAVTQFGGTALHMGHTLVYMDKWNAEEMLALCERHRVTNSHLVPTHFKRLLALPEETRRKYDLSSLRWMIHAAAPCPVPVKWAMLEWWGDCVYEYYAATEGGGTLATPADWKAHPGTVGKAWPISELLIVDEQGEPVPTGTPGTIYMKMMGVQFEYKGDPAKTAANRLKDHFTVGDIGYLDEEGFLYLCDRKADMIISGGTNIYPAEIENELMVHPKVADVAVFGIPDEEWGEQIKAVVEPAPGSEPGPELAAELLASLEGRLARMKWPKSIDFIAEMPREPNGKLLKRKLRDPYWEGHDRAI
ncbi:O-succinylbenzoic acid--CoA ligase [[Actinomadura] parvosata subsp. kistnae]|uniref:Acyl-CoA synthetase n=1 Tax=[Actinomadura] parvosata subsp. kistnae TaxID=1909395 RepID=A0A1V0A8H0_9ACTN|nr:acyl-CoA synthetase [Nonomuraea sp. ATCC 55076]AQZ66507.1 acyl-CoA synthetase [Nonomuraea sp. ATCC 55076]SPL95426.1 O-succinylbenzoic acid--CoA ligase [Actinomadura parvosata subsp. kistnae]